MKININIKKNLGVKIASLVFALFLWFLVSSSEYITTSVYAPVDIDHLKKGYIAVTNEKMINLALKGSSLVLKGIDSNDVKVEIDVSSFKTGKTKYIIKERDFEIPPGVEILNYQPRELEVFIDKLIEKDLKVVPITIGKIKSGLYLEGIYIKPEYVKVSGALSVLSNISYIETMPVSISDVTEDKNIEVPIKLVDGIKKVNPQSVNATINIEEEILDKEYKNIPVEVINETAYKVQNYTPASVRVKLRGRSDILEDTSIDSLVKVYIDLKNIEQPGTYIKNVNYKLLNEKVKMVYIIPDVIRVEVE